MSKKVCHITSAHQRYDVRIFIKQCRSLAKADFDVYLLVNDKLDDEIKENVNIVSTRFHPKNRFERFFKSKNIMLKKALEINADIYQLHDPDLLRLGTKLKKNGKKVIFDSHEDVPVQILDKKWVPYLFRRPISIMYEYFEKKIVSKFDAVISVTPHIVERLKKVNQNTIMIANFPELTENNKELDKKGDTICFAGGISEQWNHENVLKAIDEIDNIKYILAGTGPEHYLKKLMNMNSWGKVDYIGRIPFSEVKNIYNNSDIGIALNSSKQVKDEGTLGNTKLFEFMESGLPVICTNYPLWEEIIKKNNCGLCVNPQDVEEIKNAIEFIIKNRNVAKIMGNNGRKAVKKEYNWNNEKRKLIELYKTI